MPAKNERTLFLAVRLEAADSLFHSAAMSCPGEVFLNWPNDAAVRANIIGHPMTTAVADSEWANHQNTPREVRR